MIAEPTARIQNILERRATTVVTIEFPDAAPETVRMKLMIGTAITLLGRHTNVCRQRDRHERKPKPTDCATRNHEAELKLISKSMRQVE